MNRQPTLSPHNAWFDLAGRCLLTLLVGAGGWWLLDGWGGSVWTGEGRTAPKVVPHVITGEVRPPGGSLRSHSTPWPHFPGSSRAELRRMTLDGVQVILEEWATAAAASDVLDYYRSQMQGRGWADVTEAFNGITPEWRWSESGDEGLAEATYLDGYRRIVETQLVLRRGKASCHVDVQPGPNGLKGNKVRIMGMETTAIGRGVLGMEPGGWRSGEATVAVEISHGQRYKTMRQTVRQSSWQAFEEAMAGLRARGWRPVFVPTMERGQKEYFAWLARDGHYAAVHVTATEPGEVAAVLLTEVGPEQQNVNP